MHYAVSLRRNTRDYSGVCDFAKVDMVMALYRCGPALKLWPYIAMVLLGRVRLRGGGERRHFIVTAVYSYGRVQLWPCTVMAVYSYGPA